MEAIVAQLPTPSYGEGILTGANEEVTLSDKDVEIDSMQC